MRATQLIDYFQKVRSDPADAVIEGVQALKHAARFKAEFHQIITTDISQLSTLLKELAPDISLMILNQAREVDENVFQKLSPQPPRTKVIATAKRKNYQFKKIESSKLLVFLEDPRDLENIGAVIRVSAAAGVAGVAISGPADIWHPAVIRGAAGLQYAVPVFKSTLLDASKNRPIISLDPIGKPIKKTSVPNNALLVFGTERYGISQATLKKSDHIVRLPMKEGVSSLNLATSVAATLYMM